MPIYEYQCPKCGNVFEEWRKSSEAHQDQPCPVCGTPSPRIMSRTSFVLKGDGWYVSDYGYRKGISEESGAGAPTPMKAKPVTPAKQGEKSLAKTEDKTPRADAPKSEPVKTETAPSTAASGTSTMDAAKE